MSTKLIRVLTPEEEELAKKKAELAQLQNVLAERELYITNLRAESRRFSHDI